MPIFKIKNDNFFKRWTPEMAYVLGFFTADGSMIRNKRGAHFLEFEITDKDLLEKIRELLGSNHKITARKRNNRWKTQYRLQIGSKIIYNDLLNLGLTPNKSKTIKLPVVHEKYFPHFLRGYFDGDGNVTVCTYRRKERNNKFTTILQSGFTSGSKDFLASLQAKLSKAKVVKGGTFYYSNNGWRLYFSINDSKNLYEYMYKGLSRDNNLFLKRKKIIFEKYLGA
ncbi:MAG: LAGLIDADG family homing endonuclease [Candidatus Berkelbacteria bacterium]|nr:LAGLIDADG family homing endonuclease [Candidatus Berkelbacteria bacterium]